VSTCVETLYSGHPLSQFAVLCLVHGVVVLLCHLSSECRCCFVLGGRQGPAKVQRSVEQQTWDKLQRHKENIKESCSTIAKAGVNEVIMKTSCGRSTLDDRTPRPWMMSGGCPTVNTWGTATNIKKKNTKIQEYLRKLHITHHIIARVLSEHQENGRGPIVSTAGPCFNTHPCEARLPNRVALRPCDWL
jgi:hypothetical protein